MVKYPSTAVELGEYIHNLRNIIELDRIDLNWLRAFVTHCDADIKYTSERMVLACGDVETLQAKRDDLYRRRTAVIALIENLSKVVTEGEHELRRAVELRQHLLNDWRN